MSDDLYLERDGAIATLVINRPEKHNPISYAMYQKLPGLVQQVEEDATLKVLILRGAGEKAFAAGADISEFKTIRADSAGAKVYNEAVHNAETALVRLSKPAIAMVHGFCIGGGCGLAMACDFRFSDDTGLFGITPAKLGLVYSLESTKRLVDLVGPANAKYILFSGRQVEAQRALQIGLVDEVHPPAKLGRQTQEFAAELCSLAQFSVRGTKRIIRQITDGQAFDDEATTELRNSSFDTADYAEGVQAFLAKRAPRFTDK